MHAYCVQTLRPPGNRLTSQSILLIKLICCRVFQCSSLTMLRDSFQLPCLENQILFFFGTFSALSINVVQVYAFLLSEDFRQKSSSLIERATKLAYVRNVQGPLLWAGHLACSNVCLMMHTLETRGRQTFCKETDKRCFWLCRLVTVNSVFRVESSPRKYANQGRGYVNKHLNAKVGSGFDLTCL